MSACTSESSLPFSIGRSIGQEAFGLMHKVSVMIVARHNTPLFGLDWCIQYGIQMPPGVKIGSIKQGYT